MADQSLSTNSSLPNVLITGDIVRDVHLYGGVKTSPVSEKEPGTTEYDSPGGAALSLKLFSATTDHRGLRWDIVEKKWQEENTQREKDEHELLPRPVKHAESRPCIERHSILGIDMGADESAHLDFIRALPSELHSFGVWTPHPDCEKNNHSVWRVDTHFGYGSIAAQKNTKEAAKDFASLAGPAPALDTPPALILIDDGGIAFRHENCKHLWPDLDHNPSAPVVLKMSAPVCRGNLYPHLIDKAADRLTVIIRADDLRSEGALIRRRLSWEQTATDTINALHQSPFKEELLTAKNLVVSFGSAGALWIEKDRCCHLVYAPNKLEKDYNPLFQGSVYGYQTCLTVAIAHHLLSGDKEKTKPSDRLIEGIKAGLNAKKKLIELGHGIVGIGTPGFPVDELAMAIGSPCGGYIHTTIPCLDTLRKNPEWTILSRHEKPEDPDSPEPLYGLGQLTAKYGLSALSDIPSYSAGDLFSVDRGEIESLRTLETLIRNYEQEKVQKKPLSIGVFGPPGAGKSFGVEALSEAVLGEDVKILEFNLSQFKDPDELIGAFHRVRDEVLKGHTPVAFWDEFDSQKFKWLQYLLAPMQDGAFQEGQITHPIGKCIFVFAGGTSHSFQNFEDKKPDTLTDEEYENLGPTQRNAHDRKTEAYDDFRLLKGPDFASRLHGHLNVLGPNKRSITEPDAIDITWPIRRALMLRGILGIKVDKELHITPNLLNALLSVREYKHGSRSFQKILDALKKEPGPGPITPSSLPPDSLLRQETDAVHFQELLEQDSPFINHENIEELASAIHENYRKQARDEGWGPRHILDFPQAEIPVDYQAANRAAARRIPEQLSLIGFQVIPNPNPDDLTWQEALKNPLKHHLERLAKTEHLGWNAERIANGWTHHSTRDDNKKHHPSLVPWDKLSSEDQEKDRANVRLIPQILQLAGFMASPWS